MDKRHLRRQKIVQQLYAYTFTPDKLPDDADNVTKLVVKNLNEIDEKIEKYADKYEVRKIAKVDLAILRLAIYELLIDEKRATKSNY